MKMYRRQLKLAFAFLFLSGAVALAQSTPLTLLLDPAQSYAEFTLSDPLHTVHGKFSATRGEVHFDPATGQISGEFVINATTGDSGNSSRDHKMHKDVLESQKYPEITFAPDRIQGAVSLTQTSHIQVHGMFGIHGGEHELTAPADVTFTSGAWQLTAHFDVPYTRWGMKNPSVLLLRVGDTVAIDFHASGKLVTGAR
jgi:polyisoprenoid-binding protein YceI